MLGISVVANRQAAKTIAAILKPHTEYCSTIANSMFGKAPGKFGADRSDSEIRTDEPHAKATATASNKKTEGRGERGPPVKPPLGAASSSR
jgi:hypothetical protein